MALMGSKSIRMYAYLRVLRSIAAALTATVPGSQIPAPLARRRPRAAANDAALLPNARRLREAHRNRLARPHRLVVHPHPCCARLLCPCGDLRCAGGGAHGACKPAPPLCWVHAAPVALRKLLHPWRRASRLCAACDRPCGVSACVIFSGNTSDHVLRACCTIPSARNAPQHWRIYIRCSLGPRHFQPFGPLTMLSTACRV